MRIGDMMMPKRYNVTHRLLLHLVVAIYITGCAGPTVSSKGRETTGVEDVIESKPRQVSELPDFVLAVGPDKEQIAPEEPVAMGHGFSGSDEDSCHVKFHNITRFKVKLFLKQDYEFTLYKYKSAELAFPAGAIDLDAFAVKGEAENLDSDLQWSENIKCEPGGKVALQFKDE